MKIKLSNRLSAVASFVPKGSKVADIGTDHGYLAVHLVSNDICPVVIATDRAKGPLKAAEQLVGLLSLEHKIQTRFGDGLKPLAVGEVDTVCIAGMGGMTIRDIVLQSADVAASVKRFILQPQRNNGVVRQFMCDNGFKIVAEDLVEEDGFFYEIMVLEAGEMTLTPDEAEFGPLLLAEKHPLLTDFLELKIKDSERLLVAMANNNSEDSITRKDQLKSHIDHYKATIAKI